MTCYTISPFQNTSQWFLSTLLIKLDSISIIPEWETCSFSQHPHGWGPHFWLRSLSRWRHVEALWTSVPLRTEKGEMKAIAEILGEVPEIGLSGDLGFTDISRKHRQGCSQCQSRDFSSPCGDSIESPKPGLGWVLMEPLQHGHPVLHWS